MSKQEMGKWRCERCGRVEWQPKGTQSVKHRCPADNLKWHRLQEVSR